MLPERWAKVNQLFYAAMEKPPGEWSAFLKEACADDPQLREEVESLLDAHQRGQDFIETSAVIDSISLIAEQEAFVAAGRQIGSYKIIQQIGRGGMGTVYLASRADGLYEKPVAVKLMKRGMDSDEVLRHFRNEQRILGEFDHPNIARLFDGGITESGLPYFVMEYVDGRPIDDYCDERSLSITKRLEIFQQVCAAVSYAHRNLVVHRDLKPSNILITTEGAPKLLDFGIAKILQSETGEESTVTGILLMTPEYASPEQAQGLPVTTLSDVYSLGVILYELLTGHDPYPLKNRSHVEIARAIAETQPILPSAVIDADGSKTREGTRERLQKRLRGDLDNIALMALRKEPRRRYQSVDQMSEDIHRHLQGLPITARKDIFLYRSAKFLQRNKTAIAITVFALLAITISTGIIQWRANRQARYANEFAEEIRYIETMLLSTYTAPLHDVRPKMRLARQRLQRIEKITQEGGDLAYGPGNNALGQGYLLLKEYDRASEFLQKAWNSGYKSPSTAYALGKIKGILWRQALIDSDRLASRAIQDEARKRADEIYQQPAIQFLKSARDYAESPAYVEALISLYEKHYKDAVAKSSQALEVSSHPYEVLKLQGDIHFEVGQDAMERKDKVSAVKAFQLAGEAYKSAAEIARSDQDIYLADAERWLRTASIQESGKEKNISFESGLEACDKATIVQPDNERLYLYKSEIYLREGTGQMYTSGNPRPAFLKAIEFARVAGRKKTASPEAHDSAATAFFRLAEYENANSEDPRKSLNEAITEENKALQLNPQYSSAYFYLAASSFYLGDYELSHGGNPIPPLSRVIEIMQKNLRTFRRDEADFNLLGLTYLDMGEYRLKRGEDPRVQFTHAVEQYQSGLKLNPNAYTIFANMGLAGLGIAKYQINHGINPASALDQSIQQYDRCLTINSNYPFAQHDIGAVYLLKAEHELQVNENPLFDLATALQSFVKSLEMNPDLTIPHISIGTAHYLLAKKDFYSRKDPTTELDAARKALEAYMKLDQTYFDAFRIRSNVELLAARWEIQNHRSPESYLNRAIADAGKANELDKENLEVLQDLAETFRWQGEWRLMQNKNADDSIQRGMETILLASKLNPEDPETLAIQGSLKLLKAEQAGDPERRIESGREAVRLLTRGLAANPFLKREYESIQKQAEETLRAQSSLR